MATRTVLFATRLDEDCTDAQLLSMLPSARQTCAELGVTGVLLFDGEQTLQLLHGPTEAVDEALRRWLTGSRHIDGEVLWHSEAAQAAWASTPWQSGFCDAIWLHQVRQAARTHGDALSSFFEALSHSDLG
jgi:Sensors of blue-light using FAD